MLALLGIGNSGFWFALALAAFLVLFALSAVTIARRADEDMESIRGWRELGEVIEQGARR